MREIRTEIEISAPSAKVWRVLMELGKWEEWNPIVKYASGTASIGSKPNITTVGKDGKEGSDGPSYSPVILTYEEPKLFRWRAKMMAGFMFTNDKIFELEETASGTRLIHTETFSGLLVSMFWNKLNEHVPSMLNSMNEALKTLLEQKQE